MNTTDAEATLDANDDFAEQWDDLHYSCSQCEQFAQALAFIWDTIEAVPDGLQRRRGISVAHFLPANSTLRPAAWNLTFGPSTRTGPPAHKMCLQRKPPDGPEESDWESFQREGRQLQCPAPAGHFHGMPSFTYANAVLLAQLSRVSRKKRKN